MEIAMKKWVGLVVFIAALVLGSYYGMGVITERALKHNIAMINQANEAVIDVVQYHRGWFRSKALLNGQLHIPARTVSDKAGVTTTVAAQDVQVQIPLDIHHGPVMLVDSKPKFGLGYAQSDMRLPPVYAKKIASDYTTESIAPTLNFSMFISYLNKSVLHINVPAFKLVAKKGNFQFQWSGLRSNFDVSSRRKDLGGSVTIDGLNLMDDKASIVLGTANTNYDLHQTKFGLFLGDGNLNVSAFSITQEGRKPIELHKLAVTSSSGIENDLLSSHFKATIETLNVEGRVYGPAVFAVSITNLDAEVLARINEQSNRLQQATDDQRRQVMMSMLPELPILVSKGAGIDISELHVNMPEGRIDGTLHVSLPVEKVENPFQLIQKIQGQGKLVFSDAVLKRLMTDAAKKSMQAQAATVTTDLDQQAMTQVNERIAAMLKSGLLTVHGSDYIVELKLAAGQLSVNGMPFSPAMMKF